LTKGIPLKLYIEALPRFTAGSVTASRNGSSREIQENGKRMDSSSTINREASEPAYIQLAKILREEIAKGSYLPGDRLPSESELCSRFKVSPMTVRRSVNTLIEQRVVSTVQGSGTYVRALDLRGVTFSLQEFHDLFRDKERTQVRILEALIMKADKVTADKLAVPVGSRTILIRRLLTLNGDPAVYHWEHLIYDPFRPIVEAELEVTSLDRLFVGKGERNLKSGKLTLQAAVLSKQEADMLNTIPMQPAFRIEHVFLDLEDKPTSWGRFVVRADRLTFSTTVGSSNSI
jgi:DNA-binding GntR family transcriptional regulator